MSRESSETTAEAVVSSGAKLTVYWCPICKRQTDRSWHSLRDGGLIPQNDTEHDCDRIDVSPLLLALMEIEAFPVSGYHAGEAQRMAREALAAATPPRPPVQAGDTHNPQADAARD